MSEADLRLESPIQNDVLIAVTALPGGCFWRANCGLFLTQDRKRYVRANIDGCADILGCYRGIPVAIETKRLRGKQRDTQITFQENWERAGGKYIIARSVSDALSGLGVNR